MGGCVLGGVHGGVCIRGCASREVYTESPPEVSSLEEV